MKPEKAPTIVRHEPLNSAVTESNYVPQETPRSCGVASILMARNLLTGHSYPHTVKETIDIMKQKGYKEELLGRTLTRDRSILIGQLNEIQDAQLVYRVLAMPKESQEYTNKIEKVLNEGAIVLVGFKKPFFNLPEGMEVEAPPKSSHGAVVHGFKKGQDGETIFIVTDPEPEIAKYFGRNIEVPREKFMDSLSDKSKMEIEVVFPAS